MAKQLTLFECCSDTGDSENNQGEMRTQSSNEGNGRNRISNTTGQIFRILQENTIFIDNPTSSTTIIINDSSSLTFSLDGNNDSSQDCAQHTDVQDEDVNNAHPEFMTSSTSAADDPPTDIAAGPDQTPVQPKIKFQATLKRK